MLDNLDENNFESLVKYLFRGYYKINLYSGSSNNSSNEIDIEIVWDNKILSKYNQYIKNYLPMNLFEKKLTLKNTILGWDWLKAV